jgi:hypothetical protein
VAEVFIGLLQLDPDSYLTAQPNWVPTLPTHDVIPESFGMMGFPDFCRRRSSWSRPVRSMDTATFRRLQQSANFSSGYKASCRPDGALISAIVRQYPMRCAVAPQPRPRWRRDMREPSARRCNYSRSVPDDRALGRASASGLSLCLPLTIRGSGSGQHRWSKRGADNSYEEFRQRQRANWCELLPELTFVLYIALARPIMAAADQ